MEHTKQAVEAKSSSKEIVLSCIRALNEEDFKTAREYMNDDFFFDGIMGSRDGADAYFQDMKKMKLKYKVIKAFGHGDDVCVLYDLTMSEKTVFGCGWYTLQDGKISRLKVVFDPRPFIDQAPKK